MATRKLTADIITAAIDGFAAQKKRIDAQIAELRQMLTGGSSDTVAAPESARPRRKMSAAARKRIGDAQRKRWAAAKEELRPVTPEAPRAKRKISRAGKRRIIEATKKRWAAYRARKAAAQRAAVKPARKVAVKRSAGKKAAAATQPSLAT